MTEQEELDSLYIQVGEMKHIHVDDPIFEKIERLEKLINPPMEMEISFVKSNQCDCGDCWECAAQRGGCPEDV